MQLGRTIIHVCPDYLSTSLSLAIQWRGEYMLFKEVLCILVLYRWVCMFVDFRLSREEY